MKAYPQNITISAVSEAEKYAARLFSEQWEKGTGFLPILAEGSSADFIFKIDDSINNKDTYIILESPFGFLFYAKSIRGLIYAYSHFLRKTTFLNNKITLTENICGTYTPQKEIRGHQISYRTTPNTYDAWDYDAYFTCQLDMMAFGANTIEHNGTKDKSSNRNPLMKYEQEEFLVNASRLADKVDMNVSLWHANGDEESESEALQTRDRLYGSMARLDYCFVPGGDPGSMQADAFLDRCKKISAIVKKHHKQAQMHISAQAPHCYKDWGYIFKEEINKCPEEIDSVIMGPNHAFTMHELRRITPSRYPLRFYPDITHNLRCEYPVNFQQDDWHFAFCNTLSRESVNPRPTELRTLNRLYSSYTIGSVSYSEGVHDDVNKAVWSALEWNKDADLREILLDYSRFFIFGINEEEIADIILLLEKSWQGDPVENPCIDVVYAKLCAILQENPQLKDNWRFMLLYFRGCCDMLVKTRRIFENKLCKKAYSLLKNNNVAAAIEELEKPFDTDYFALRGTIAETAKILFRLIGLQLDVENYYADSWERGATLETIDNNVSDRAFLLSKLKLILSKNDAEQKEMVSLLLNRNKTDGDEIYYSVALHNLNTLGIAQDGEFYMDIQGDRPYTKANPLPMSMTKMYDHFSFKAKFGGFRENTDYTLTVVYKDNKKEDIKNHTVTANGKVIYCGNRFGGTENKLFDETLLTEGFVSAAYLINKSDFINGTLDLCISEATEGVNICELWIKKV